MGGLLELAPILGDLGVVAIVAWLVFTGRLVPGRTVDRLISSRDRIIEQQAATIERQQATIDAQQAQVGALVEQGQTSARALEALRRAGEGGV